MTTMMNTLLGFAEMMLALLAGALANFDNGSRGVGDVGRSGGATYALAIVSF